MFFSVYIHCISTFCTLSYGILVCAVLWANRGELGYAGLGLDRGVGLCMILTL